MNQTKSICILVSITLGSLTSWGSYNYMYHKKRENLLQDIEESTNYLIKTQSLDPIGLLISIPSKKNQLPTEKPNFLYQYGDNSRKRKKPLSPKEIVKRFVQEIPYQLRMLYLVAIIYGTRTSILSFLTLY